MYPSNTWHGNALHYNYKQLQWFSGIVNASYHLQSAADSEVNPDFFAVCAEIHFEGLGLLRIHIQVSFSYFT